MKPTQMKIEARGRKSPDDLRTFSKLDLKLVPPGLVSYWYQCTFVIKRILANAK